MTTTNSLVNLPPAGDSPTGGENRLEIESRALEELHCTVKYADPDIPILNEAKAEYTKLQ
jgi:hypothetical protein